MTPEKPDTEMAKERFRDPQKENKERLHKELLEYFAKKDEEKKEQLVSDDGRQSTEVEDFKPPSTPLNLEPDIELRPIYHHIFPTWENDRRLSTEAEDLQPPTTPVNLDPDIDPEPIYHYISPILKNDGLKSVGTASAVSKPKPEATTKKRTLCTIRRRRDRSVHVGTISAASNSFDSTDLTSSSIIKTENTPGSESQSVSAASNSAQPVSATSDGSQSVSATSDGSRTEPQAVSKRKMKRGTTKPRFSWLVRMAIS